MSRSGSGKTNENKLYKKSPNEFISGKEQLFRREVKTTNVDRDKKNRKFTPGVLIMQAHFKTWQ